MPVRREPDLANGTRVATELVRTWRNPGLRWERAGVCALIVVSALLHIVYLLRCPLQLAPDEAHYWDWSRNLDWSYYSKGPLVAWLIRLSCELLGSLSERLVGSPMLAVRMPAIACSVLSLIATYILLRRLVKSERIAFAGLAVLMTWPVIAAGGTVMTIDAPFTCLWAWALVFAWDALFRNRSWSWPVVGLLVGLGILAKYTMVLFPLGLLLFLISTPYRSELRKRGVWIAAGIAFICCLPIAIWNMQHDWITLRHVGTQAGATHEGIRWFGPIKFIAEQTGLLFIVWFMGYAGAMWANRPGRCRHAPRLLLWWMSAPVFVCFLLTSLKSPGQLNWAIAAYISGSILAIDWLAAVLKHERELGGQRWRRSVIAAAVCGVVATICLHFPLLAREPLSFIADLGSKNIPCPIRRLDPSVRLRGWTHLAAEVDRICAEMAGQGEVPCIATTFWNLSGEVAFYCEGHPTVYCIGTAIGQRMSQYDLWRPNPIWNVDSFRGRTFILIGDLAPELATGFDHIESTHKIWYQEGKHPICYWNISIARGYRGFGPPSQWPGQLHY